MYSVAIVFSLSFSRLVCVFTQVTHALYGSSPDEFGRIIVGLSIRERPLYFGGHWYYSSSRLACTAAIFAHLLLFCFLLFFFTKEFSHEKSVSMGPAHSSSSFPSSLTQVICAHDFTRLCTPAAALNHRLLLPNTSP